MGTIKKARNTNIEVLRLFAIFIVVINHYSLLGGFEFENPLETNAIIVQFLHFGGKLGVDLFIFISGYYMSSSKKVGVNHIVKFIFEVTFYSIIFAVIGYIYSTLTLKGIATMLIPIPFSQWPFITCYFMLMCLAFWTNKFMHTMSEKQHLALIVFLGITWCVVPTFIKADFAMSTFTWYMYIYIFAGYVRRVFDKIKYSAKTWLLIGSGSIAFILISEVVFEWVGVHFIPFVGDKAEHFRSINSIFILVATVALVIGTLKLKPRSNKFVQTIASTTLGIFMIHDNKAMIPLLWTGIFKTDKFTHSNILILHAFGTCISIVVVCIIIDLIRQKTIGKLEDKLFGKTIEKLDKKINSYLEE